MEQLSEQLMALNRVNLESAIRLAGITLDGAERMLKVQLNTAKHALEDGAQKAKSLAEAKDWQGLAQLTNAFGQPHLEQMAGYLKSIYEVATLTHSEVSQIVEEQLSESNHRALSALDRLVKITPAGSEAAWAAAKVVLSAGKLACDNALNSAKQFAEMAKANGEAVVERAAPESKRKAA